MKRIVLFISHVANGHRVTRTLLQGVLDTSVIFFARILGTLIGRAIFPGDTTGFMQFFLSHPPLDARIAALRAGG